MISSSAFSLVVDAHQGHYHVGASTFVHPYAQSLTLQVAHTQA